MSKRDYQGDPIDMTWKSGPWANDGETVYATDPEEGDIEMDEWPEGATDPEDLNEDQRAVIMAAVRNPNPDSFAELTRLSGVDKSSTYANTVLRKHWGSRYEDLSGRKTRPTTKNTNPGKKIPDSDIEDIRRRALDGETTAEISVDYGCSEHIIQDRIRGDVGDDSNSEIPPLVSTSGNQAYVLPDTVNDEVDEADTDDAEEQSEPTQDIEPSPVYGQSEQSESGQNKALTAALVVVAFVLGRFSRGDSE